MQAGAAEFIVFFNKRYFKTQLVPLYGGDVSTRTASQNCYIVLTGFCIQGHLFYRKVIFIDQDPVAIST